ncbi:MAG TPA: hypothetical protein VME19_17740 [Streptosporangiaceae bacterium]|nr:hypothetical protein [Streptosporangiaceae bacterium]
MGYPDEYSGDGYPADATPAELAAVAQAVAEAEAEQDPYGGWRPVR